VRRNGNRLDASVRVLVGRPQRPKVAQPDSRVGVDVGVRRLATVATAAGTVIECVENPRPLQVALRELRHLCGRGHAARKARASMVNAPQSCPGCIAGSMMSALITCMS